MTSKFPMIALGEVALIAAGGGAPQNPDDFSTEGIPFIRAGSLKPLVNGVSESSQEHLSEKSALKHGLKLFPANSVLFAKSGMSATKGHIYRLRNPAYVVNHLAAVVSGRKLDAKYLEYVLGIFSPTTLIQDAAYPSIRLSDISAMKIPLPSLPEQHRIAAILEQADALRIKRREVLAQLDSLTQSIFIEMFGNVALNPKFPLGFIRPFVEANSGKSAKSVLSIEKTDIPIYGGNGINGWATNALYEQPVLIFGRVGQQCGNAFITKGPSWVTDNAIVVRISDSIKLNPIYVLNAFQGSDFSSRVKHLDLPFINQGMILDNPIPIPPLLLQQTFATRIQAVETLKASHSASLVELDALFASLQHRAFQGEL